MRRVEALRIAGALGWALLAVGACAQILRPAGGPASLAYWQGGTAVALLSSLHPDTVDGWTVRAIVEPVSKPVVVRLATRRDGAVEEATLLSFEARATGAGLEDGRTYRVLASLDPRARPSNAKRLLLLGYRPDAHDRLRVVSQSRLDRMMGDGGTTVEAGLGTLFAGALVPTQARRPATGGDSLAASYQSVLEALIGAPDEVVRMVTMELAGVPETGSPVAPRIEDRPAVDWVRATFAAGMAALPQHDALRRLRYGGLLAAWERPHRALPFLEGLPRLLAEVGLRSNMGTLTSVPPLAVRDDREFLGRLDLLTGLDGDAVFGTLWNTPLRRLTIDPRVTRAPSVENQRRVVFFFDDPSPSVRAEAYSRLASWNTDWERLKVSNAHWSDTAHGEVIDDESALRAYWEAKLRVVQPREP